MAAAAPNADLSPGEARLRRERRALALVLAALLATTVLLSPLTFGNLPLFALLLVPFLLVLVASIVLAPLAAVTGEAQASQHHRKTLARQRHAAAAQHALPRPAMRTPPADQSLALAKAVGAAAAFGIHFGSAHLADEDFVQAFHSCEIRHSNFRHGDHLRYTVLMLQRVPAGLAEATIGQNLRRFLRDACGSDALFHATRTHAWVAVLQSFGRGSFAELLQQHTPSLRAGALHRFYSEALLDSDAARQRVTAPDREPLPRSYAPISKRT